MTTESVATEATNTKRIPGLVDLLRPYSELNNPAYAARMADAADNALEPINQGIAAIGHLLWCASYAKDIEIDPLALGRLGLLLEHLAEYSDHVGFIQRNATFVKLNGNNRA